MSNIFFGGGVLPGVEWIAKSDSDEPATAP
jgi:hypothetical protein